MQPTEKVLMDRGDDYGFFMRQARVSQVFKRVLRLDGPFAGVSDEETESLELLVVEMSLILCGDSSKVESWRTIETYAKRVADQLDKDRDLVNAEQAS